MMRTWLSYVVLLLLLPGCDREPVGPADDPYAFNVPKNFPEANYTFDNNPVTPDGFELGRALFYDPILSLDSSISCANCHQQAVAFADPVHRFSVGVNDKSGIRNAPAIQNMAFQTHFFWDGGVKHLDFVPINAINNELEFAEDLAHVVEKLRRSNFYSEKFNHAFGSTEINSQRMLYALSQFMNLMISANSKYDKHVRSEGEQLSTEELEGRVLFQSSCATCHSTDLFTDGSFRNNGLDASSEKDIGREMITEFSRDRGKFKVPSLRNVELTSPYMHDGRFKTLELVLQHYVHNVKGSETLDPILKDGIQLSDDDQTKIIAFLKTLTDREFTRDKRFTNPF